MTWAGREFCSRFHVCQRKHKSLLKEWQDNLASQWDTLTADARVSNIAAFLQDFIPKRNLTHLLPAPLADGASLKERAHHNYISAMSVLSNVPLETISSSAENRKPSFASN